MSRDCTADPYLYGFTQMYSPPVQVDPVFGLLGIMPINKNNAARKAKRAKMSLLKAAVNRKSVSQGSSSSSMTQEAKAPTMMSNAIQMAPTSFSKRMAFSSSKSNSMRSVYKREFICSINGTANFAVISRFINPGLKESFPWLHKIAADWQQYRFKSFRAIYITRSGAQTSGSLILSPEYNVNEGAPENEQEAVDTQDAVEDVCWKEVCSELDTSAMFGIGPRKQVRRGPISADLSTYDAALLSVCTVGMATDNVQVGKLYFEYEVEFYVPQSTQSALPQQNRVTQMNIVPQSLSSGQTETFNVDFIVNPLGLTQIGNKGPILFPSGNYRVDYFPTVTVPGGEDYAVSTRLALDNTVTAYVTSTGRTDTYGIDVVQYYTYLVGSDGTRQVAFQIKCTDTAGQIFNLSNVAPGKIIVTSL